MNIHIRIGVYFSFRETPGSAVGKTLGSFRLNIGKRGRGGVPVIEKASEAIKSFGLRVFLGKGTEALVFNGNTCEKE